MATTTKGYPYPVGTDRVMDGDNAIQALAQAVDTKLGIVCSGRVSIVIAAGNTPASVAVTFPVGLFPAAPAIVAMCVNSSSPQNNAVSSAGGGSVSGATLWGNRATAGTMNVDWLASYSA